MQNKSFFSAHHILITAAAVMVSLVVFAVIYNIEQRDVEKEFDSIAGSYQSLMDGRVGNAIISLDTVSHSVELEKFIKRDKFSAFSDLTIKRMDEVKTFFWVSVVSPENRKLIENENWNSGLGGKSFFDTSGNILPPGNNNLAKHMPLLYAEPTKGNEAIIGFDFSSNKELAALFDQARDYYNIVPISGKLASVLLPQGAPANSQLINLIHPVYENPRESTTIGLRRERIRGFVVMQVDIGVALEQALAQQISQDLNIYIVDVEAELGEEIIYFRKANSEQDAQALPYQQIWQQKLSSVRQLDISGRQWKVVMLPTDSFYTAHHNSSSWAILVAGLVLSVFLYNALLNIHRRDSEIRDMVRVRTKELKDSEIKVRSIIENVAEGIITINTDGIIETINPAAEKIFGYEHDEIIGLNINTLIPQDDRADHDGYIDNSTLNAPRIINKNRDLLGLRKNGQMFPMELNVSSMELDGQRKFIGLMHDITERKLTEETLRNAMQGMEQSADAIFITDKVGNIEYVNRKFIEYTGYEFEEVKGRNPRILSSGDTPKEIYTNLWETILSGDEWRGEMQDKRKDGTIIWASVTISPVRDKSGIIAHFVSSHRDITKRKETERVLRDAMHQTEIANKAKSELMANMSHELRTPLNAIIGFSDLIINNTFGKMENKEYAEYVGLINNSGRHLLDIINDILDVSAIEAGRVKLSEGVVEMRDTIATITSLISQRAEQGGVDVSSEIMENCPALFADERRIKQILLNLVSNSVKFTEENGSVKIKYYMAEDGRPTLSVCDTGIGMTDDELALALSQFGQVDGGLNRKNEGTGLGLPLTLGLIELHDAEIKINSRKNEGTDVFVHFPKARINTEFMEGLGI